MKIISKYRDYYDSAVGLGIDKTIQYVRKTHDYADKTPNSVLQIFGRKSMWSRSNALSVRFGSYNSHEENVTYTPFIIGFCGKLYIGWFKNKEFRDRKTGIIQANIEITYDSEKVFSDIKFSNRDWELGSTKTQFNNFLEKYNDLDAIEVFREFQTPAFLVKEGKTNFVVNPVLKDLAFAKVIDPYTAFQEVQMFISGVLGSGDDVDQPEMTEAQKVAQHGMDKWSFRKKPTKK
jgi:hypothetical protein